MTSLYVPVPFIKTQYFDSNGAPVALGTLYTYAAGGTTPQSTYNAPAGSANSSPAVTLDAAGRADIFLDPTLSYRLLLKDAAGNTIFDEDNVWIQPSGTYTPTLTNATNVAASSANVCNYMRLGNIISVSGTLDCDPTAAAPTLTILGISLPIAANFATNVEAGGTAVSGSGVQYGAIFANSANDRVDLQFSATTAANATWSFHFSYRIP